VPSSYVRNSDGSIRMVSSEADLTASDLKKGYKTPGPAEFDPNNPGPFPVLTNGSGPTIAHGVDLGQQDPSFINNLPISDSYKQSLLQYVGVSTANSQDPKAFVATHPLSLPQDVMKAMDVAIYDQILARFVDRWNHTANATPFDQLSGI